MFGRLNLALLVVSLVAFSRSELVFFSIQRYWQFGNTSNIIPIDTITTTSSQYSLFTTEPNRTLFLEYHMLPIYPQPMTRPMRQRAVPSTQFTNYRLKAAPQNIFNVSGSYMYFSETFVNLTNMYFNVTSSVFNVAAGYQIIETGFVRSAREVYVLVKNADHVHNDHILFYQVFNGTNWTSTNFKIPLSEYSTYIRSVYHNSTLFLLFTDRIQCYTLTPTPTPSPTASIPILTREQPISEGNSLIPSFALHKNLLIYCLDKGCKILDLQDDWIVLQEFQCTSIVTDIRVVFPYLVIGHYKDIQQYDIQVGEFIGRTTNLQGNNRFEVVSGKFIVTFRDRKFYRILTIYIDNTYYCNITTLCTQCLPSYQYNSTTQKCIRQQTYTPKPQLEKYLQYTSIALSTTSSRLTPSFIWLLSFYLDDLSYYTYHHGEYPGFLEEIFQAVFLVNLIRLNPFIFDIFQSINEDSIKKDKNYLYWQNFKPYSKKNPTGIYFLYSAQETYKSNFLFNLALFLSTHLLFALVRLLRHNNRIFKQLYRYCSANLVWWSLLVMLIEANVMKISFCFFLQVQVFCTFSGFDRVNLVCCVGAFFVLLAYCFAGYPLCYAYCRKRHAEMFTLRTQYKVSSYFAEPLCSIARNLIRGSVHALLIKYYSTQILSLTIIDFGLFFVLCFFRKCFSHPLIFLACLITNAAYFVIDLVFFLRNCKIIRSDQEAYSKLIYFLVMGLSASILFVSLTVCLVELTHTKVFRNFKEKLSNCFNRNRIRQNQQSKQKSIENCEKINNSHITKSIAIQRFSQTETKGKSQNKLKQRSGLKPESQFDESIDKSSGNKSFFNARKILFKCIAIKSLMGTEMNIKK